MEKLSSENLSPLERDKCESWLQLDSVGPDKPIGYLPIETIENYVGKKVDEVIKHLQKKGLEVKIFTGVEWPGFKGSLYTYDKVALQKVLDENKSILIDANWPVSADEFIENLKVQEKIDTPIYKVIAMTFGDKFSEELKLDE